VAVRREGIKATGKEELPMITFVRTASVAPGKLADAIAFNQQVTKLAKDKYFLDVHASTPIGGNPGRMAWTTSYPSLAEFDAMSIKLNADADYQKLIAANVATLVPGSVHDELWRRI
jgi:hypothetical protein